MINDFHDKALVCFLPDYVYDSFKANDIDLGDLASAVNDEEVSGELRQNLNKISVYNLEETLLANRLFCKKLANDEPGRYWFSSNYLYSWVLGSYLNSRVETRLSTEETLKRKTELCNLYDGELDVENSFEFVVKEKVLFIVLKEGATRLLTVYDRNKEKQFVNLMLSNLNRILTMNELRQTMIYSKFITLT